MSEKWPPLKPIDAVAERFAVFAIIRNHKGDNDAHLMPMGELGRHARIDCLCHPTVITVREGTLRVVHHLADTRLRGLDMTPAC